MVCGEGEAAVMMTRRTALAAGSATLLAGCDKLGENATFRAALASAENANFVIQRSLTDRMALAPEFAPEDRSPTFRANGTREPAGEAYAKHAADAFADWRVSVDGLVARPQAFSLAQIKLMPSRSQITRHDCVEGWSAIGKWTGVPLKLLLDAAGLQRDARYLVFHCADVMAGEQPYYESIDLIDAHHPQTILAWALNDAPLPVGNGAPLRLRVERQLGYKQAKYVQRIEAVASLGQIGGGKGGYWEDRSGYQWYAGI
jgi:DMSO/TMAO reductase YedYZ molybdopterin-dependent catalytic subunit